MIGHNNNVRKNASDLVERGPLAGQFSDQIFRPDFQPISRPNFPAKFPTNFPAKFSGQISGQFSGQFFPTTVGLLFVLSQRQTPVG